MNLYELTKKQAELKRELRQITNRIEHYPRIGDLAKHKTEETEFKPLTETQWHTIEFYNDWPYYEVKKENL